LSNVIKGPAIKYNSDEAVPIEISEEIQNEILKVDENTAGVMKENIILKAKQDANKMIEEAREKSEQILNQAKKDALLAKMKIEEEGRQRGYQEGFHKGSEESKRLLIQAKTELDNALKEKEKIINGIEPKMVDLIVDICEKVLKNAVKVNKESILYIIKKGFSEARDNGGEFTIKISEGDYPIVLESKKALSEETGFNGKITIIKDTTLKLGDCIIETELGSINCGLDAQLQGLKQDLLLILG